MSKEHLYLILLSFTLHLATRHAKVLGISLVKNGLDNLAIKTLAVHESIADPKISYFNDLFSISKGEIPKSIDISIKFRPTAEDLGPIVTTENNEKIVYTTLTASLAKSTIELVQYKLRALNKSEKQISYHPEAWNSEYKNILDDIFLL